MLEIIVAFAIGLIVLGLIGKIVSLPFRLVWKLVTNSVAGAVILFVVKLVATKVEITFLSALIVGVFGVPGVVAVLIYTYHGH